MSYRVKEVFATLQGEGAQAGRVAVFCRFSGCNLWTGQERHRATAVCRFCDTDFVGTDGAGGGKFADAASLAAHVAATWPALQNPKLARSRTEKGSERANFGFGSGFGSGFGVPLVVCTGGEPLLQLDESLVEAFHDQGFEVAIETNGTLPVPRGIDWVCVSPKAEASLLVESGHELKLVYPQVGAEPERYEHLAFGRFSLQPMDGPELAANTEAAVAYCLAHPGWQLSVQTHKMVGIR